MSSIRPLITITILVAVGVFLFTKINESPVPVPAEMGTTLERAPAVDVPPLATAATPPMAPTTVPSWSDPPSGASENVAANLPPAPPMSLPVENPPMSVPQASSPSTASADLPPIPELPPLAPAPEANAATTPAPTETTPIALPADIPVAHYPGNAPTDSVAMETPPSATSNQTSQPPTVEAVTPAPPTTPVTASDDRYGTIQPEPSAMAATPPPAAPQTQTQTSKFAAAWPEIHAALDRQELVAAYEMLSRWYGNPTLTPAETQQVELLLSQLAGTVVYSTENRLEPPYTAQSGDTLQTIAQQYNVPWQLLAKINGIPAANMVQPGQQLKVIHGPFAAVVELDKRQLTLLLDSRYAGRFPITVAPDVSVSEGQWVLEQKLVQPTTAESGVVSASYAAAAIDHVLVLRNESPTANGATISITAGPGAPSGPTAVAPSAIRLSPSDVEEVADILSVGSPVTIRR